MLVVVLMLAATPNTCASLEKRAAQTAEPDAKLWNEMARCRVKANQLVLAVDALDAAIEATGPAAEDSDEPESIEETMRQTERALLKGKVTKPIAAAAKKLALRSLANGNYERAHRLFERSLSAKGDDYTPAEWNSVARARLETEDARGAALAFMRAEGQITDDIDLLGSALPFDDVPAEGGWQARCVAVDSVSKKKCGRQWLACFELQKTAAVLIDAKTLSKWASDPSASVERASSAWVTESRQSHQSSRVVDIDVCAGSVIEVKRASEPKRTSIIRREVKAAAP